ncbi:MFS transporter [Winogradskya humida]|uniref:MFS transporter n=1 Tax=Winogradskya humida TaxID=113566 RepID=UPI00194387E3|nr:MFS transporter [Actinoplanes humidus]
MPSYRAVLNTPHAARTFSAALVGRLSYGIVYLSLVLAVTRATGSYAVAGIFTALFGLTSSVLSPLRARLIERYGLRRVLIPMAFAYASLLVAIAIATWRPGVAHPLLWVLAVAAGTCTPPLGPIMRSLWTDLVADEALRQRAFSLDTVCEELLYVTGPLLAGLLAAVVNPALGVAVSAALVVTGSVLLVTSPAVRAIEPSTAAVPATAAGTGNALLFRPVLVSAAVGMCLGALGLLVVAFADREQHLAAVAWVEAALAVGSVAGGLAYGAVTWRLPGEVRLPLLAIALGVSVGLAGLSGNLVVLVALVGVAGLFISPALTTAYLLADSAAAPGARLRAGAWVNTAYNVASSLGAALAGLLLGRVSVPVAFAVTAAVAVAGGVLVLRKSDSVRVVGAGRMAR